jgi:hypothetical protein
MLSTTKLLHDGTVAQGVVLLTQDGGLALETPIFVPELVGNFNNYDHNRRRWQMIGRDNLINNARGTLWEGPTNFYSLPTVGMQMVVKSTSANDTNGGSNVRKIRLVYLDASYIEREEIITMNGLTGVLTAATNIFRVNSFHAYEIGPGLVSAGEITLKNTLETVTYAIMSVGLNTARQAIYTVPDGWWLYVTGWEASSGSSGNHWCQMGISATAMDGKLLPGAFLTKGELNTQNNNGYLPFSIPIPLPPRADVTVSAISDAPNANVFGISSVFGWLERIALDGGL